MRIFLVGLFLVALLSARADEPKPAVVPVPPASVSNCMEYLDAAIERLETLAETFSNETVRAHCINDKLTKARSLDQLVHSLSASLEAHTEDEDQESVEHDRALIFAACARIDRLAEEAAACEDSATPKKRRHAPPVELAPVVPRPRVVRASAAPAAGQRDATTCLKQVKFAAMLADVLGVEINGSADAPSRELAKRNIEPFGGWAGDECLTVDDLCVVVARALNLKVEAPDDPYSYVQAVRNDGLPVDSVLPRRRKESEPAVLLEAEVRIFLARGYAARMPSGRRLQPD
ncbi:MAG: hypothetical protein WCS70_07600 [Verrucomicrobiota bacterium]